MRRTVTKRATRTRAESRPRLAVIATVGAVMMGAGLVSAPAASARASEVKISQEQAQGQIDAAGVTWSASGGCSIREQTNCTSLEQVNQDSITGVIGLKNNSGCAIDITGGTEDGHEGGQDPNAGYTHWNGWKIDVGSVVDDCVYGYVINTFPSTGTRGDGAPLYESGSGNIYAWEYWANHWDITFLNAG